MQARGGNTWPSVPGAPTSPVASPLNQSASVAFVAPADTGYPAGAITGYRVTSTPGGFTGTGLTSPVTVTGLTNGTAYTFTVAAQNVNGYGPESVASNSVTPIPPNYIEQVFSTYLYAGNGSTQTITNGINLSGNGGMVWCKIRNTSDAHALFDTVRGFPNWLVSNTTGQQNDFGIPNAADMVATSTGFSMNNISSASNSWNSSGNTFASWTFREQPKFFDVVTWTSTNSSTQRTISHNLGSTPGCVIIKSINNNTNSYNEWYVVHRYDITAQGYLNRNFAFAPGVPVVTAWTDTTVTFEANFNEGVGNSYIVYIFAHNAGGFGATGSDNVISCGSVVNSGNPQVTLGYEPQWVLFKSATSTSSWYIVDNMRGLPVGSDQAVLLPNSTAAEVTNSNYININATGFTTNSSLIAGETLIYIAIRRGPMAVPTTGTSVFAPIINTGVSGGQTNTSNFPVDLSIDEGRITNYGASWFDRLRGAGPYLISSSTAAEANQFPTYYVGFDSNTGVFNKNYGALTLTYVNWLFRRAPSFFDQVCYTGTGSARTVTHNLGVVPELMIVKNRTTTQFWVVYSAFTGATQALQLNTNIAAATSAGNWNNTAPTSSVFTVGTFARVNESGSNIVAYLFATCPGVSKVGSYTGTGATQTIACGFAAGARFVLIKRTDSTGDWYAWDSVRGMVSGTDPSLLLNTAAGEVNANSVYTITTGFQIVSTDAGINASGGTYIFLAIA